MKKQVRRIVIIDHFDNLLYVEDIDLDVLNASPYNGSEQAYIEDTYTFKGNYSWDYITDAQYFSAEGDGTPYDLMSAIDCMAKKYTYDVCFDDEYNGNSKNFTNASFDKCMLYINTFNGSDESYFKDYKGGTVSIVCNETEETVYSEKVI